LSQIEVLCKALRQSLEVPQKFARLCVRMQRPCEMATLRADKALQSNVDNDQEILILR